MLPSPGIIAELMKERFTRENSPANADADELNRENFARDGRGPMMVIFTRTGLN
jgi:hypothetical protein